MMPFCPGREIVSSILEDLLDEAQEDMMEEIEDHAENEGNIKCPEKCYSTLFGIIPF